MEDEESRRMKQKMRVERDVHVFVFSSASLSIRTFDRQTLAHNFSSHVKNIFDFLNTRTGLCLWRGFCGRETSSGPRAALAAIKLSRCDSLRLVLMLCLPKPSASRGQRSTQNTKTSHAENHENTPVQCAHDKWLTNEN